jgi:PAS domain S-box-containing protein
MPKKAAPGEIELSGETYKGMVENSNDLVWVLDAQGSFVYINRRAEEVSGYALGELRGTGFAPLVPKDDLPRLQKLFSDVFAGREARFEVSFYAKNGSLVSLSANAAPLVEKRKAIGIACFGQDITERKRAEEALRRSEAALGQAQRIAHVGNWDWDVKSDRARWSDEMCRVFGVEPGGLRGREESLKFMHPDDRESVRKAVADSLEKRRPYDISYRIVRPGGAVRFIHAQGEAFFGKDGKAERMIGTVQDVTERRQAEEALKESEERYRTWLTSMPKAC